MKRRVLSLVIALALCLNLCPTWGLAAAAQSDAVRDGSKFTEDVTVTSPHVVSGSVTIDTDVYTLTASGSTAIRVTGTGALDLRGRVIAKEGSGVEVQTGGSLRITESGTQINSVGGMAWTLPPAQRCTSPLADIPARAPRSGRRTIILPVCWRKAAPILPMTVRRSWTLGRPLWSTLVRVRTVKRDTRKPPALHHTTGLARSVG